MKTVLQKITEPTPKELELLRHMLGTESKWPGYRNYFCAEIGSADYSDLMAMCVSGLAERGRTANKGRDQYFVATEAGCRAVGLTKAGMKRAGYGRRHK